ncbi:MAG: hypothetical protein MZV63_14290 [Marinilabiliales bacterium]|nr:hypothetical protein [Marinilabiliales bacterium]
MLPLGHLRFLPEGWSKNVTMNRGYFAMVSHGGREDVPNFLTRDEQRTVMTLWTIARCPLMFGGHLPASDAWTMSLITNAEVLAVNQRSRANRQLFHANGLAAWAAGIGGRKIEIRRRLQHERQGSARPGCGDRRSGAAGRRRPRREGRRHGRLEREAPRRFRGGVRPARPVSRRRIVPAGRPVNE